jgi:hypothetical protein
VESGEWRVEGGEWRVESGEWRVESEGWRVKGGECHTLIWAITEKVWGVQEDAVPGLDPGGHFNLPPFFCSSPGSIPGP